jgi:hypothetical protein
MNFRHGLFRLWIAVSVVWVVGAVWLLWPDLRLACSDFVDRDPKAVAACILHPAAMQARAFAWVLVPRSAIAHMFETVAGPPEHSQRAPVGSRVLPHPPVVPSNGRALEVGRKDPAGISHREGCPVQNAVTPVAADLRSIPTAARPLASAAGRCPLG